MSLSLPELRLIPKTGFVFNKFFSIPLSLSLSLYLYLHPSLQYTHSPWFTYAASLKRPLSRSLTLTHSSTHTLLNTVTFSPSLRQTHTRATLTNTQIQWQTATFSTIMVFHYFRKILPSKSKSARETKRISYLSLSLSLSLSFTHLHTLKTSLSFFLAHFHTIFLSSTSANGRYRRCRTFVTVSLSQFPLLSLSLPLSFTRRQLQVNSLRRTLSECRSFLLCLVEHLSVDL